ncbi:MAG: hypothetical protein HGA45_25405 [Chloroflexales bacterium]|nr:hypothetical protein [Chloroflexales bacterium]
MNSKPLHVIALRYCVDDLPGASIPHARLQKILSCLQCGGQLTQLSLGFLQQQGLHTLHRLAIGELPYDSFHELALTEQAIRIQAATAAKLAREAEARIEEEQRQLAYAARLAREEEQRQLAYAAQLARESDPTYRAKIKNQQLRARYGIYDFVEPQYFGRLMSILKRVDADQRLEEEDSVWLSTVGKDYFTDELRIAYHRLEAEFFASEFHKTHDPWAAINASSHYRKCDQAHDADALLSPINIEHQSPRIQAALCTTHGGAMRDMKRWDEALRLGERAHALQPKDYRPCTLLGAIHMETGQYDQGKAWYDKAIERGATADAVDRDIRTILSRLTPSRRRDLEDFLIQEDPRRFAWVQKRRGSPRHRR